MWVSWVTAENCTSVVEFSMWEGVDDDDGARRVVGGPTTRYAFHGSCITEYAPNFTVSAHCDYESAFLHHVQLRDLSPQATYAYRVGGRIIATDGETFSPVRRFTTQLSAGALGEMVRFSVVGDLGQTKYAEKTMEEVNRSRFETLSQSSLLPHSSASLPPLPAPSLLMLVGDLSYADGDGKRWDVWGETFSPVISELPLVAFPGNHEVEFDATVNTSFLHWRHRFRMPEVLPEQVQPGKDRIVVSHSISPSVSQVGA